MIYCKFNTYFLTKFRGVVDIVVACNAQFCEFESTINPLFFFLINLKLFLFCRRQLIFIIKSDTNLKLIIIFGPKQSIDQLVKLTSGVRAREIFAALAERSRKMNDYCTKL